jgi:uncharacterized protein (TIGR01777 family)
MQDNLEKDAKPVCRILVSGASGLIGRALILALQSEGHQVVRLVRSKEQEGRDAIFWDPAHAQFSKSSLEGFDAVIHLAGEGITDGRWTSQKKKRLFVSRCRDSWVLSQALSHLEHPPKVVLCASAVGFYGNRPGEVLTESSIPGTGFLPDLCVQWEKAMQSIQARGARVVHLRFGAVLSFSGGMLKKLLLPFKLGLGGKLGSGKQILSWIALSDVVGATLHILSTPSIHGAVNVVSPYPVTQAEFAQTLARHLHRPAWVPLPAWLLRLAFGELADEVLLASAHVVPEKLIQSGYSFKCSELANSLRDY